MKKYGVPNVMQNAEINSKVSRYKLKEYIFPSGKKTIYQGYENFCLNDLIFKDGLNEDEIYNKRKEVPNIPYFFNGERMYFPDIYIPNQNRLIEVKSRYTFENKIEQNIAKALACVNFGFKYEIRIYNNKGEIDEIINF